MSVVVVRATHNFIFPNHTSCKMEGFDLPISFGKKAKAKASNFTAKVAQTKREEVSRDYRVKLTR